MIGINKKGGMMDNEFEKYIATSICPLYLDMEDTPGQHMLLKVDSGPGRNGKELLMKCHFHGLHIYPCLPNVTSVQQETDINYGPFKSIVHNNLKQISSAFYAVGEVIPLIVSTFDLIIYGDTILVGKINLTCRNALAVTFDVTSNLCSWSKVSTVPHTRKCLSNPKVLHDGVDKHIPISMYIRTSSPRMTKAPPSSTSWDTKAIAEG
jgi:hypothetical protein